MRGNWNSFGLHKKEQIRLSPKASIANVNFVYKTCSITKVYEVSNEGCRFPSPPLHSSSALLLTGPVAERQTTLLGTANDLIRHSKVYSTEEMLHHVLGVVSSRYLPSHNEILLCFISTTKFSVYSTSTTASLATNLKTPSIFTT